MCLAQCLTQNVCASPKNKINKCSSYYKKKKKKKEKIHVGWHGIGIVKKDSH